MPPKRNEYRQPPRTPEAAGPSRKAPAIIDSPCSDAPTTTTTATTVAGMPALNPTSLALNALYLLGFRKEDYFADHQHVRYTAALDPHTFDRTNERALLLILHFLLSRIVPQFDALCSAAWPYTDVRSKNAFKRVVEDVLQSLVDQRRLAPELSHASVLTTAKGSSAWRLLAQLTSLCVQEELASRGIEVKSRLSSREEGDSKGADFDSIISAIRADIATETTLLMREHLASQRIESDRQAYAEELYERYKRSRNAIESLKQELKDFERTHHMAAHALSEAGRVERSAAIIDIEATTTRLFEWRKRNVPERSASAEAESPGTKALLSYLPTMQFVNASGKLTSSRDFNDINAYLNELSATIAIGCERLEKHSRYIEEFEGKVDALFTNLDTISANLKSIENKLLDVNLPTTE